ncbi:MAG: hypothetical protein K1X53_02865 [Candidatus Sumerlaeaceae bacterium]|nr:hypothetical protein [Candidatus Sumerlaeaceae bacterium]
MKIRLTEYLTLSLILVFAANGVLAGTQYPPLGETSFLDPSTSPTHLLVARVFVRAFPPTQLELATSQPFDLLPEVTRDVVKSRLSRYLKPDLLTTPPSDKIVPFQRKTHYPGTNVTEETDEIVVCYVKNKNRVLYNLEDGGMAALVIPDPNVVPPANDNPTSGQLQEYLFRAAPQVFEISEADLRTGRYYDTHSGTPGLLFGRISWREAGHVPVGWGAMISVFTDGKALFIASKDNYRWNQWRKSAKPISWFKPETAEQLFLALPEHSAESATSTTDTVSTNPPVLPKLNPVDPGY